MKQESMQLWTAHMVSGVYRIVLGVRLPSDRLPLHSSTEVAWTQCCEIAGIQVSELSVRHCLKS